MSLCEARDSKVKLLQRFRSNFLFRGTRHSSATTVANVKKELRVSLLAGKEALNNPRKRRAGGVNSAPVGGRGVSGVNRDIILAKLSCRRAARRERCVSVSNGVRLASSVSARVVRTAPIHNEIRDGSHRLARNVVHP